MSETIVETIIPGTYIAVRAEGLLTIGAISTGNIGIAGTAEKGNGDIEILSSFEQGIATFGEETPWDPALNGGNLTLVRALKLLFDNGARTVYAKRVYDADSASAATFTVSAAGGALTLKAGTPGTWGNQLQIKIEEADAQALISNDPVIQSSGVFSLSARAILAPESADNIGNVIVREQGRAKKYKLKLSSATSEVVQINPSTRELTFAAPPSPAAEIFAGYSVPADSLRKVTLRYLNFQEEYIVPSLSYFVQSILDSSKFAEVAELTGAGLPAATNNIFEEFSGGDNGEAPDGLFGGALEDMVEENVQIVVVAGLDFTRSKSAVLGHVEKTENLGRERIAVIGADSSDVEKVVDNSNDVADKRVVLVAPGLKQRDAKTGRIVELPPYFAAAAVAGKLSSMSSHISLTNKTLAGIDALGAEYNYGEMKSLVENRVLAIQKKRGVRIVKGITTHDEAFRQISVRRIIDYIKQGTRRGANQYIGKLNNARVRGALHTTLNGFLTDMLTREFLTGYKLEVFADRAMEIRGEVQVTMDLNPTFSIDVIRVIMNLS